MEPLKITAALQCGVIADAFLPIDGLIYYYAHREAYGVQDVTLPGQQAGVGPHIAIPLAKRNTDDPRRRWYYAASFAQWEGTVARGQDHWNKRFDQAHADLVSFGDRRGKVIVEAGTYRAYHMPVYYRHALAVSWYVVGDPEHIERLLAHATHIGKKPAQGYGAVLRWSVEPWPHDWSVRGPGGQLMRAVPSSDGTGMLTGFRPSYWLPKNQARCHVPTYAEFAHDG